MITASELNNRHKRHKVNWTNVILIVWAVGMIALVLWRLQVVTNHQEEVISNQHTLIANQQVQIHNQCVSLSARHLPCKHLSKEEA